MSWQEWDKELDLLARDLASLRLGEERRATPSPRALQAKQIAIVQLQVNIDRKIEKIRRVLQKDLLLLPQDQTLMHWAGVFCDTVQKFLNLSSTLNSEKLWLKLIHLRLGEPGKKTNLRRIEPDDLVDLSLRRADLSFTEKRLSRSLVDLDAKRKDLFQRYGELEVRQAMAEAAGSLQARLGTDADNALASPTMRALADYLRWISTSATAEPMSPEVARLDRWSRSLMRMARGFITGMTEGRAPSARKQRRFQAMLAQLNDLEEETRVNLAALHSGNGPAKLKLCDANPGKNG